MKRLILFIGVLPLMLLLSNCTHKESKNKAVEILDENVIVEIPDLNFMAYLLENFDTNKDGKISLSEAKAVTVIDCSNRDIKDLTGIEKFENLERLNCSNNQLDELDVRYNKKLEWLNCTNNVDPLNVNFAMSSPISNKNFKKPEKNTTPELASDAVNPIDVNKCIFDYGKTDFVVWFEY